MGPQGRAASPWPEALSVCVPLSSQPSAWEQEAERSCLWPQTPALMQLSPPLDLFSSSLP